MKPPTIPDNEEQRLAELHSYELLDREWEVEFAAYTLKAAKICKAPIAAISLVDAHRQWFLSRVGLDARETSRNISFCGHAIAQENTLTVKDALKDERFSGNPLVTGGPKIRFYSGHLLVSLNNYVLGTLCVIDTVPRDLSDEQMESLQVLAECVIGRMEFLKSKKVNAEKLDKLQSQYLDACKLADLGRMSATIMHEIKGCLSVIAGNADLMLLFARNPVKFTVDNFSRKAEQIKAAADRADHIIDNIKKASREGANDPFVNTAVKNLVEVTRFYAGIFLKNSKTVLRVNEFSENLSIDCRETQLSQVLLNLLQNAHDAVQDQNEDSWIQLQVEERGSRVEISVMDSGPPIPVAVQTKLMTAFFTTKDPGKGTGLGLSFSKKVLEDHGGNLTFDANCPHTCFVMHLPKKRESIS
jgi:signal transduction histidine kinase